MEVSEPNDAGQVAVWSGSQLAGCRSSSMVGVGYDQCSFGLLREDGGELWTPGAAEAVDRWVQRRCVARLFAGGELAWAGRLVDCEIGMADPGGDVTIVLRGEGAAQTDLTNELPNLPAEWAEEEDAVSLTEMVTTLITAQRDQGGIIAELYGQVEDTGSDIGPVEDGETDTPLGLIQNAQRAGSEDGAEEYGFYVFDPAEGPILKPLCDCGDHGAERWRVPLAGTGAVLVRAGGEYANVVRVVASTKDGSLPLTELLDENAIADHGGVRRVKVLSVDQLGEDGAIAAQAAQLQLRVNPRSLSGTVTVSPSQGREVAVLQNIEGGEEPGWRVRAGDLVRSPDAPGIAGGGLLWLVQTAEMEWVGGVLTLTPDERRVKTRPGESERRSNLLRREVEPSLGNVIWQAASTGTFTVPGTADVVDTIGADGLITFSVPKTRTYTVLVSGYFDGIGNINGGRILLGFEIDNEGYSSADTDRTARSRPATDTSTETLERAFRMRLRRGTHTARLYAEQGCSGVNLTDAYFRVSR